MKKIFLIPFILANFQTCEVKKPTIIIAGSDFQASSHEQSKQIVDNILYQIQEDNSYSFDGAIFCGDYTAKLNNNATDSEEGISYLKQSFEENYINEENVVLVQGNHDPLGTRGLSSFGKNDDLSGRYGCFVINEDNYMWMQGNTTSDGNLFTIDDEEEIKKTSLALEQYLKEKEEQKFYQPIFIASHLGLHYSMRCYEDGDGHYAKYLFDVLNNHPSLNIIYLFGHNHSHGWDNYLGGCSLFLSRGEDIYLSTLESPYSCYKQTLNFTYMNAGYTGYYTTDDSLDECERILSMSMFEITDNEVIIKRYSEIGQVNLKEKGVLNTRKGNEEKLSLYPVNEDIVEEYTLSLNKFTEEKNNLPLILIIISSGIVVLLLIFLFIKQKCCKKIKKN